MLNCWPVGSIATIFEPNAASAASATSLRDPRKSVWTYAFLHAELPNCVARRLLSIVASDWSALGCVLVSAPVPRLNSGKPPAAISRILSVTVKPGCCSTTPTSAPSFFAAAVIMLGLPSASRPRESPYTAAVHSPPTFRSRPEYFASSFAPLVSAMTRSAKSLPMTSDNLPRST